MKQQKYEFLKGFDNRHITIGFGSYGQVKLARNTATGDQVAIKFIYNKNARDQVEMHTQLQHPNIVRLLNHFYEEEKRITYMVLEYVNGGTLFEKIKTTNMSKKSQCSIFRDVCSAVAAMHANKIMHRDIKPENILLTKNDEAKLCDFGFATICGDRKTLCGTYEYMAPEMIQSMTYGREVDIWALGVLLFEMIEGVSPFRGESPQQVLTQMKKNIFFSDKFTEEEIGLIRNILRVNPKNRPTAEQILNHKYFSNQKKNSMLSTCSTEIDQLKDSLSTVKTGTPTKQFMKVKQQKRLKNFFDADSPLSPKKCPLDIGLIDRIDDNFLQGSDKKNLMFYPTEPNTPKVQFLDKSFSFEQSMERQFNPIRKPLPTASIGMQLKQALPLKNKRNLDLSVKTFNAKFQQCEDLNMSYSYNLPPDMK